ncbi:metallophosphoesterase family protein [Prosthecobacter fluviatilis]|uniref:Metallophosphoesterase family protein n=1 Tax=Prosthecobacter fluviatilis TaxID=445931 RepID=A0ABW0KSK2_9BACT
MHEPVAIISDIHGNLPALKAVIEDIEKQGIRERVCLGDIVGYGAQPAECLELLIASDFQVILRGNHEVYVAADEELPNVSAETAEVIRWTRGRFTLEQRAWLGALPMTWQGRDCEAVHASLHQPEQWSYVLEPAAAARHFAHQSKPLCFIGHSHQPKMFVEGEDRALHITSLESVRANRKQVVNVGAVGQPRDKDERACYVVYRRAEQDVWWRRIPYDIAAAQKAILDAGLPGKYAHRLAVGK